MTSTGRQRERARKQKADPWRPAGTNTVCALCGEVNPMLGEPCEKSYNNFTHIPIEKRKNDNSVT